MLTAALYHCECRSDGSFTEQDTPPTASYEYYALPQLYFCEECDAIRCPECIFEEVSLYFCPLCSFEVPTASVRSEAHRCARNCFLCPSCDHTLTVAGSDATAADRGDLTGPSTSVAEGPYFLSCSACLWNSKEVGITFEKPTGLARAYSLVAAVASQIKPVQLQKNTPTPPALVEFDALKDHFDPFIKGNLASTTTNARGIPPSASLRAGLSSLPSKYGSLMNLASRARTPTHRPSTPDAIRDELAPYKPTSPCTSAADLEKERIDTLRNLTSLDDVAPLSKRVSQAWQQPMQLSALLPQRVPLQAKRTKRCATCKHVLTKPESKSGSTKFRMKFVAVNYLPALEVFRRPPVTTLGASRISAAHSAAALRQRQRGPVATSAAEDDLLRPGRTYSFELAFTNPLYEPIHVKLEAFRPESTSLQDEPSALPYTFNLPTSNFPVDAFDENDDRWDYDNASEDEADAEMQDADGAPGTRRRSTMGGGLKGKRRHGVGILKKRANRTTVLLETTINKDYHGPVMLYLLVTYIYSADDSLGTAPPKLADQAEEATKAFSFWTSVRLGEATAVQIAGIKSRIISEAH